MEKKERKIYRWLRIQDEGRMFFTLQLVFAALQCVLAYVIVGQQMFNQYGIALFALYGILLLLLATRAWQSKIARIAGRCFAALIIVGVTAMLFIESLNSSWDSSVITGATFSFKMKMDMFLANVLLYTQSFVLMTFPALAVAARRIKKTCDIVLLHSSAWLTVVFAVGTLLLYYEPSWSGNTTALLAYCPPLFGSISADILLFIYVICSLATAFSVYMLYPFGKAFIKARVETARARLEK